MGQKFSSCTSLFTSNTTTSVKKSTHDENIKNLKNLKNIKSVSVSEPVKYYVKLKSEMNLPNAPRRSLSDSHIVYGKNKRPPEKHLQDHLSRIWSSNSSLASAKKET